MTAPPWSDALDLEQVRAASGGPSSPAPGVIEEAQLRCAGRSGARWAPARRMSPYFRAVRAGSVRRRVAEQQRLIGFLAGGGGISPWRVQRLLAVRNGSHRQAPRSRRIPRSVWVSAGRRTARRRLTFTPHALLQVGPGQSLEVLLSAQRRASIVLEVENSCRLLKGAARVSAIVPER